MLKNETERNLTLFEAYILFSSVPLLVSWRIVLLVWISNFGYSWVFTACQRSCGKVMFPLMFSVYRVRGSPHEQCPWCIGPNSTATPPPRSGPPVPASPNPGPPGPSCPLWTSDMGSHQALALVLAPASDI